MNFEFLNCAVNRQQDLFYKGYNKEILQGQDTVHIAYGIDDNFVMPMGVAIVSIAENNQQENIVFHVLTEKLSQHSIQMLQQLVDENRVIIIIHDINADVFENLPTTEYFTKATYNRFLLPKILRGIARKVIYLDADILCLAPMRDLKNLDFEDKIVAVVQDIGEVAERQVKELKLKTPQYFNAGFLYIDIEKWNQEAISEKALQFSFDHLGKLNWLDQDALNVVLENKALFIADKYDYIFDLGLKKNMHVEKLPKDTVFVHYAGRYKPWHSWCMHPLQRDFLQYLKLSPWKGIGLKEPKNYKDMKKMAHSYMRNGKIINGVKWYIKYSYCKIISFQGSGKE